MGRSQERPRRSALLAVTAIAVVALVPGCGGDSSTGDVIPEPGPCSGTYSSAYASCMAGVNCVGLECLYYTSRCGGEATAAVYECCAASYTDPADRQTCVDSLGASP